MVRVIVRDNSRATVAGSGAGMNSRACLCVPKMKLKLKGRRFDTTEEIQAESQRVLDALTEKDFQEAFQKWSRRWDRCLDAGGNYFEGDGGRYALW